MEPQANSPSRKAAPGPPNPNQCRQYLQQGDDDQRGDPASGLDAGFRHRFGGDGASAARLDLHGFSNTIGALSDGGVLGAGVVDNARGAATLTAGAAIPVATFPARSRTPARAVPRRYQGTHDTYLDLLEYNTYRGTTPINGSAIERVPKRARDFQRRGQHRRSPLPLLNGVNVSNALTISGDGALFSGHAKGGLAINNSPGDTATYSGAITLAGMP